jgi:AcrR family transcriptional regulator
VLDAARQLFIERGYVATTMDQIAQRARVSKPTVFAAVGSKGELLKQVRDVALAGDDAPIPVGQRPWVREQLNEPDPKRSLRLYARNVVRMAARYGDIDEVLRAAAAADPEMQTLWRISESERRYGATHTIDNMLTKTRLKKGLTRDQARDIIWLLISVDPYQRLVKDAGWASERYESWLAETLCQQLLD